MCVQGFSLAYLNNKMCQDNSPPTHSHLAPPTTLEYIFYNLGVDENSKNINI